MRARPSIAALLAVVLVAACAAEEESAPPSSLPRTAGMTCTSGSDCVLGLVCCSRGCGQAVGRRSLCGGTCETHCVPPAGGP